MDLSNINKSKTLRVKTPLEVGNMLFGKVQPQATDLEEAVLGAIMLEKGAFDTVIEILSEDSFYLDSHRRIFKAMKQLANKMQPIDLLTVVEELRFAGDLEQVGGAYFVSRLTNGVVSSANVEAHARIVMQKFLQRELIRISGEIIRDAYEESIDIFDMLDSAERKLFEVTNNNLRRNFSKIEDVMVQTYARIEDMRKRSEDITGVPTGFPELDKITYGWQPTDLIILAARPSVGKTAFALNLARNAAMHPTKKTAVAVFSLEMSNGQLVQRVLSAQSEIFLEKISRGKMEDHEMHQLMVKGINPLSEAPIFIDDTAALNIFELRAKCRRLKNHHDVGLIIIDYLQLMSGSGERNSNREQEISKISRDLKGLAKELSVPIIALSQLSREVEKRKEGNKIPQLSDLRESGAIEQDADMVIFLYRDDYYGVHQNEHGESTDGEVLVKIAKHRNGSLDNVWLTLNKAIQKFVPSTKKGDNPNNMRPVNLNQGNNGGKLYIDAPSRMNDESFDDDGF